MRRDNSFLLAENEITSDLMMERCISESQARKLCEKIKKENPSRFLEYVLKFQMINQGNGKYEYNSNTRIKN